MPNYVENVVDNTLDLGVSLIQRYNVKNRVPLLETGLQKLKVLDDYSRPLIMKLDTKVDPLVDVTVTKAKAFYGEGKERVEALYGEKKELVEAFYGERKERVEALYGEGKGRVEALYGQGKERVGSLYGDSKEKVVVSKQWLNTFFGEKLQLLDVQVNAIRGSCDSMVKECHVKVDPLLERCIQVWADCKTRGLDFDFFAFQLKVREEFGSRWTEGHTYATARFYEFVSRGKVYSSGLLRLMNDMQKIRVEDVRFFMTPVVDRFGRLTLLLEQVPSMPHHLSIPSREMARAYFLQACERAGDLKVTFLANVNDFASRQQLALQVRREDARERFTVFMVYVGDRRQQAVVFFDSRRQQVVSFLDAQVFLEEFKAFVNRHEKLAAVYTFAVDKVEKLPEVNVRSFTDVKSFALKLWRPSQE